MKSSTKILLGFLSVIILILTQMAIVHRTMSAILQQNKDVREVEVPLERTTHSLLNYDAMLTGYAYSALINAQEGNYGEVENIRLEYDAIGIKLDDLLKRDARYLLNLSKRSQEQKNTISKDLEELDRLNILLVDLETKAFEAIDERDFATASSLLVGEEYRQYKGELLQYYEDWINIEEEVTLDFEGKIIEDTQLVIYLMLGASIAIISLLILTLLFIRSFVAEQLNFYKLFFDTSTDAVMTLKPPVWDFTSCNKAAVKLFNLKNEKQFITLSPAELSPDKQPDGQSSSTKSKQMIEKAMKEGLISFKWMHKKYKGENFSATVVLKRIEEKNETYLQATVKNVGMQK